MVVDRMQQGWVVAANCTDRTQQGWVVAARCTDRPQLEGWVVAGGWVDGDSRWLAADCRQQG